MAIFGLACNFVTLLTFVLPCHLIVSDFCPRSCVERKPWDSSSRRRSSFARFRSFWPQKI